MNFKEFKVAFQGHFNQMVNSAERLFEVEVDKEEMWNLYLNSFPEGTNPIYRVRTEHDCSCCKHFIRAIGAMVVIRNNQIHTIWDFDTGDTTYQPVIDALDSYIKSKAVSGVYISTEKYIGTDKNAEVMPDGKVETWEHFYAVLPDVHVYRGRERNGDLQNEYRVSKQLFKQSLEEITDEAVETVLELINSNTLYRGSEWKSALKKFADYKRKYNALPDEEKNNWAWAESAKADAVVARIKNRSIGTLLVNISEGMELDEAVRKYEVIVAPENYKRSTAIYTKRMLEAARDKITELGYMDSLSRRFATLDDITVNNILFSNRDSAKRIHGAGDVFDAMMGEAKATPKKFSKVEEIAVDKFVSDVLPTAQEVEVYFENKHTSNMVSLIAPAVEGSKSMFKWNNGFSWAYTGNLTDSTMKNRVKAAGGKVDGDLRFSIQWNEEGNDNCDLDAHCEEADDYEICFSTAKKPRCSPSWGQLDVDIINPRGEVAVENITWTDRKKMKAGTYRFYVHQYSGSAKKGFRAEIEFDGNVYAFAYNRTMRRNQHVQVAEVTLDANGNFSIKCLLPSNISSREVWNLKTNQFVPISVIMYSPNYWDEQKGIGNKHYFFMLKGCVNPESPNGFYNEYLSNELIQHRKVLEALGSKMAVASVEDQLSGIGFSSTKRNELIVKVKGQTERIMKVKF